MTGRHSSTVAITVGSELPIDGVVYFEPAPREDLRHDSGFTVLYSDAPHSDLLHVDEDGVLNDPRVHTVCLRCLIDERPEVGRGLDLAREHGRSELVDGEWRPGWN